MIKYDIEAIKNDADPYIIAKYIGIPIKEGKEQRTKSGYIKKTYYILCPGHLKRIKKEDKNFGSCTLTDYGYHCRACDKKVDVIDMVMEYNNCTFPEALGTIADALGGRELYVLSEDEAKQNEEKKKNFPLSVEEMALIRLYPYRRKTEILVNASAFPYEYDDLPFKKAIYDNDAEEYLYFSEGPECSLQKLYEEDKELFVSIVKEKAIEQIYKLTNIEVLLLDRTSEYYNIFSDITKGTDGYWEDDELFMLRIQIEKLRNRCYNILQKIHA